jgi:uncharacterized protein YegP (UPF0339 family)
MPAAFQLSKSKDGQFYFILTAENSEPLLTSETYTTKAAAQNGIRSVRENAVTDARFLRKVSTDGKSFFVLIAANREPIGKSETYSTPAAMENGIVAVRRVAPSAPERET